MKTVPCDVCQQPMRRDHPRRLYHASCRHKALARNVARFRERERERQAEAN